MNIDSIYKFHFFLGSDSMKTRTMDFLPNKLRPSLAGTAAAIMCIMALVFQPGTARAQTLRIGISDVVGSAMENNEKIKQYRERLLQKNFQEMESWGNFMPSLSVEASYTHLNDPMQIDLSPIRQVILSLQSKNQAELANIYQTMAGHPLTDQQKAAVAAQAYAGLDKAVPPFTETFKRQDYKTATLVGVQPLFLGGKLYAARKFASAEETSAALELEKTKNEVIQETINNYLAVVLMNNVVKTRRDVLAGIERHRHDAGKLYQQGLIAHYHLLRAEVAVAEAERNLSDDENRLELAEIALKHSAGYSEETDIAVTDTLRFTAVSDSLAEYISRARENQQILKIIKMKKEAAADKYIAERSAFMPQIAAFGKYEMLPEYLSSLEPRWAVGVQMKLNIFNGLKDYSRLQNAVHLEREVTYIEAEARRKIDLWVNKSFRDLKNARVRYEKLGKSMQLAEENLRLNEKRFQSGMGTSLEVIDAQLSLEKNRIESLQSLYDYYRALTDLYNATGDPKDILTVWNKEIK